MGCRIARESSEKWRSRSCSRLMAITRCPCPGGTHRTSTVPTWKCHPWCDSQCLCAFSFSGSSGLAGQAHRLFQHWFQAAHEDGLEGKHGLGQRRLWWVARRRIHCSVSILTSLPGIVDPVRLDEAQGRLGLGKATEYEQTAQEATATR